MGIESLDRVQQVRGPKREDDDDDNERMSIVGDGEPRAEVGDRPRRGRRIESFWPLSQKDYSRIITNSGRNITI
jgi:hypothetical protein